MSYEHPSAGSGTPPPEANAGASPAADSERPNRWRNADGPTDDDQGFVRALQQAGLLRELQDGELHRITSQLDSPSIEARRLDLLERYYRAEGDAETASRRTRQDGFFVHHAESSSTAHDLSRRFARLAPELGELTVERIGSGDDGALVLRAGEHVTAVVDEYEEQLDTDEIDLREIESDRPTVSVRSLVRAFNGLLSQKGLRRRLVELLADGRRELYLAMHVAPATGLLQQGYLEDEEAEELMEFADW